MTRQDNEAAEKTPLRPLDLNPERAGRTFRAPYGIVDIGSNSVRLVVYDQLSRAPLPRFNEKLLCRLGDGLAETGEINPEGFRRTVNALRRFRAVADAMGQRLARLSARAQVLAVTHAPQVAARAQNHYRIVKTDVGVGERVATRVSRLGAIERREEIARMLAGAEITREARAAAESLIEKAE